MTGSLTLNADPTDALHAATKNYIDTNLTGHVLVSGMPTVGQFAIWTDSSHVEGITATYAPLDLPLFVGDARAPHPPTSDNDDSIATTAFVTGVVATSAATRQPLDGDLTSLAAASNVDTLYYRSATDTWAPVTMGANLAFSGGTLSAPGGNGDVFVSGTPTVGQIAVWTDAITIQGVTGSTLFQPLDADLTSLAAASSTDVLYYRSAANTWTPVTIGANMSFVSGTLISNGTGVGAGNVNSAGGGYSTSTLVGYGDATGNVIRAITVGSGLSLVGTTLTATAGAGVVTVSGTPTAGQLAVWTDADTIQGVTSTYAPLASPVLTGDPQAPTPATADNDTSVATTAYVKANLTNYATLVSPTIASPIFTGDPTAPTPLVTDNDTSVATTAFVKAQNYITSAALTPYALIADPTFTGDPKAPTPATADNDTSIATTAYVKSNLASYATLASPVLTGNPTAPTATAGDNDTSIATTAFVTTAVTASAIPSGTLMLFQQTAAPTGWTKQTAQNDKALRVVSGAASTGGVQAFSTVFSRTASDAYAITSAEMPSHSHTVSDPTHAHSISDGGHSHGVSDPSHAHGVSDPTHTHGLPSGSATFGWGSGEALNPTGAATSDAAATGISIAGAFTGISIAASGTGIGIFGAATGITVAASGGNAAHTHGMDIRVQYVDVIIASKN